MCQRAGERGHRSVPRYVHGGWYQPTTQQQRDELHVIIKEMHRQRFSDRYRALEATGQAVSLANMFPSFDYSPWYSASAAEAHELLLVARMARELPLEELHSIVTPSGYARLGRDGKPYKAGVSDPWGSVFPYATPCLRDGDLKVVIGQVGLVPCLPGEVILSYRM
jgi:hypothetical protein